MLINVEGAGIFIQDDVVTINLNNTSVVICRGEGPTLRVELCVGCPPKVDPTVIPVQIPQNPVMRKHHARHIGAVLNFWVNKLIHNGDEGSINSYLSSIAHRAGISFSDITLYRSDARRASVGVIERIAEGFGWTFEEFITLPVAECNHEIADKALSEPTEDEDKYDDIPPLPRFDDASIAMRDRAEKLADVAPLPLVTPSPPAAKPKAKKKPAPKKPAPKKSEPRNTDHLIEPLIVVGPPRHGLGNIIKLWNRHTNTTYADLVKATGKSRAMIGLYLSDQYPIPADVLSKIIKAVGAKTVDEFMKIDQ